MAKLSDGVFKSHIVHDAKPTIRRSGDELPFRRARDARGQGAARRATRGGARRVPRGAAGGRHAPGARDFAGVERRTSDPRQELAVVDGAAGARAERDRKVDRRHDRRAGGRGDGAADARGRVEFLPRRRRARGARSPRVGDGRATPLLSVEPDRNLIGLYAVTRLVMCERYRFPSSRRTSPSSCAKSGGAAKSRFSIGEFPWPASPTSAARPRGGTTSAASG